MNLVKEEVGNWVEGQESLAGGGALGTAGALGTGWGHCASGMVVVEEGTA